MALSKLISPQISLIFCGLRHGRLQFWPPAGFRFQSPFIFRTDWAGAPMAYAKPMAAYAPVTDWPGGKPATLAANWQNITSCNRRFSSAKRPASSATRTPIPSSAPSENGKEQLPANGATRSRSETGKPIARPLTPRRLRWR
jgi:hypothetical protein